MAQRNLTLDETYLRIDEKMSVFFLIYEVLEKNTKIEID